MKKYLNRKNLKTYLLPLFFVVLLFSIPAVKAQSKLDYYKELFSEEFGFEIYDYENQDEETVSKFFSEETEDEHLVILSSMIERLENLEGLSSEEEENVPEEKIEQYTPLYPGIKKNIILVCDENYLSDTPPFITCDKSFVESQEGIKIGGIIKISDFNNIELYVIPEDFLVSPEKRSEIKDYIDAVKRSDKAPEVSEDAQPEDEEPNAWIDIKKFQDTMVFEFFIISISMFVIASLSWSFLRFVTKEGRKFNLETLKELFNSLKEIQIYQKILLSVIFVMVVIYGYLAVLISFKDGRGIDFAYLISYTLDTLNVFKLNEYSKSGSFSRIMLFAYGIAFSGFLFLLTIPLFVKTIFRFSEKVSTVKINSSLVKNSLPLLILISLFGVSFFEVSSSIKFLTFTSVLLAFLFFKSYFDKNPEVHYTLKEKIIFILMALVIVLSGFFLRAFQGDSKLDYKEEDLIGVADNVVLLPYSKQLGDNTLMNEFPFLGSEPVFVNNYLVYSPIHSEIKNKNAMDFKNEGSFYIQNGDLSEIVKAVHSNSELFNVLVSEFPSNFFRIKNLNLGEVSYGDVQIEITFSCIRENLEKDRLKIEFYYVDEGGEVQDSDETLLYFPGCMELGKQEKYKVDLNLPYIESEYIYVRLVDVSGSDITDIKIYKSDMILEPTYISKNRGYTVIDSGGMTTSAIVPVTNYIFGDSYDLSFEMTPDDDGKFDISIPINELINEGVLKDRFLIWSTKKYLPVRTPD